MKALRFRGLRQFGAMMAIALVGVSLAVGCSNNGGVGDGVTDDGTLPGGSTSVAGAINGGAGSPSSSAGSAATEGGSPGAAGTAGTAGSGGLAGNGGSAGNSGSGGSSAGSGGSAGGSAGVAGKGGTGGSAGGSGGSSAGGTSGGGSSAGGSSGSGGSGGAHGGTGGTGGGACVSTTCGNGTLEGCEVCDTATTDPKYGALCSSSCAYTVSTQACFDCESAGDCVDSVANCIHPPVNATAFSAQQSAQCFAVMQCIQTSKCFNGSNSLGKCYCGTLATNDCSAAPFDLTAAGAPNGPCAATIQAGMTGVTSNGAVLGGLTAPSRPAGAAMQRLQCQKVDDSGSGTCAAVCSLSP
jgi:hypothetical protein